MTLLLEILKFEMELPLHTFNKIKKESVISGFFKPIQNKNELFEKVLDIWITIQKHAPETYVVIAGGYVAYLEGLTNTFSDIDFFIFTNHCVYIGDRLLLRPKWFISEQKAEYQFFSKHIEIPFKDNVLDVNFIFKQIDSLPENWLSAAISVLSDFDMGICAVAIYPDKNNLFRTEQASLTFRQVCGNERYTKYNQRKRKYEKRLIHFGAPSTLAVLCLKQLGWLYLDL